MMTRFFRRVATLLALLFLIVPPAHATVTTLAIGSDAVQYFETAGSQGFTIKSPVALAAAGADTLIVNLNVQKLITPFQAPATGSVPTVRALYAVVAGVNALADSIRCEQWFGVGAKYSTAYWFQVATMANDNISKLTGKTPLVVSYTTFGMPFMRLKIVNKHATLARTPVLVLTFMRNVHTLIPRSAF